MRKVIEFVLVLPFILAGFLWHFVKTGFLAGRFAAAMTFRGEQ